MDRESFLARAVKTMDVTLDDDTVIKIRKLSQADIETMTKDYSKGDTVKQMEGLRYIVSRAVCDDAGNRMFTAADMKTVLLEMNTEDIQKIAKEACKFSGLKVNETEEDEETESKNV